MTPTPISKLLTKHGQWSMTVATVPHADTTLRLALHPALNRRAKVDGAWWPFTRNPVAELPALIAAVDQRLNRTTLRVGVHRDMWDTIPHHVPARGRRVHVDLLHQRESRVVVLGFADDERIALLLLPPTADAVQASAVLRLASQDTGDLTTGDLLTLASLPAPARPTR